VARNLEVVGVVGGDLQEHAGIGAALVGLPVECRKRGPKPRQVATRFLSRTGGAALQQLAMLSFISR
jgi:hypothetical protein